MAVGMKVALPGYNAYSDKDPNHFALYVDQQVDYILIKEKLVGTQSVGGSSHVNIAHNLGYVPFALVFVEITSGVWRKLFSKAIDGNFCYFTVNSTNLVLQNDTGSSKNFAYHIFLDNIT